MHKDKQSSSILLRKKLLLKEENVKKRLNSCTSAASMSSNTSSRDLSPPKNSPLPLPPWVQSSPTPSPVTRTSPLIQSSFPSSNRGSGLMHSTSSGHAGSAHSSSNLDSSSSLHAEDPNSSSDHTRPTHPSSSGISRHVRSSSFGHADEIRPTRPSSTDCTGVAPRTGTAPRTRTDMTPRTDTAPGVEFEEDYDALAAAELDAMEDCNGWDFDTQDMLITESEMDLVPRPQPRPRSSAGQASFHTPQPSGQTSLHQPASCDMSVSSGSSVSSRSSFKPPFLQQNKGQLNTSFVGSSGKPSMFKPSAGNSPPQDDASEFRKPYQHTREMYKIFHQV